MSLVLLNLWLSEKMGVEYDMCKIKKIRWKIIDPCKFPLTSCRITTHKEWNCKYNHLLSSQTLSVYVGSSIDENYVRIVECIFYITIMKWIIWRITNLYFSNNFLNWMNEIWFYCFWFSLYDQNTIWKKTVLNIWFQWID